MGRRLPVDFKALEGRQVSMAMADGTRIDDCQLIAAPREGVGGVWVHANGMDAVLPVADIDDAWEVQGYPSRNGAPQPVAGRPASSRTARGGARRRTPRRVD